MSETRTIVKREHSNSSMLVDSKTESSVRLLEDNGVAMQDEPMSVKLEDIPEDAGLEGEEEVDTVMEGSSSSRSASADVKASRSSSPTETPRTSTTPPAGPKSKSKAAKSVVQLIGDLPRAEEAAMKTFIEIPGNAYQYGTLGRSREAGESMTCDCQYEHGVDDVDDACGHDSDCINRLTQVECLPGDCKCRSYCQNQRFQRKQYAPIEIVKTEKKGFGLRAGADIRKDTFIYEYVGDVVSQPSFLKRMRQYAEEGIRHFYFMMLQKDEFIDATKRGGIGRFANHSCNPNCYVAKWTVGKHVRMGIFAHRAIKKDEELTFNYNVDRYGHDAQPCYCGEAKCVGFIGGKTQTDLAAMDDLYLDALGITDEVEQLGLKGSKKKKGKKLDEDFIPDLKPLQIKDVPKVVQAMRQTQSRKVLLKLLTRIKLTEDLPALRQLMRLRAFSAMTNILEDYAQDVEICSLVIESMSAWPLIQRNKVDDSKVSVPVEACANSDNEVLASLAKKLLEQWSTLESGYRIPKRVKGDGGGYVIQYVDYEEDYRPYKRRRSESPVVPFASVSVKSAQVPHEPTAEELQEEEDRKRLAVLFEAQKQPETPRYSFDPKKQAAQVADILAKAAAAAEAAALRPPPSKDEGSSKKPSSKAKLSKEEKEAAKEKQLQKLVSPVVVKCLSKYKDKLDHEAFKKHAKELTTVITEKEKKSSSYKEGRLESLSDEKKTKIKKFAKEYIAKMMRKLDKPNHRKESSSRSHRSRDASTSTKHSPEGYSQQSPNDTMEVDNDHEDSEDSTHADSPDESRSNDEPRSHGHIHSSTKPVAIVDPRIRRRKGSPEWGDDHERPRAAQSLRVSQDFPSRPPMSP